jgi:pimeloyl-ACP methyl ester carboxylesterase
MRCFDSVLPHGITLSCRANAAVPDVPRVLLLHGFPEAAFVWDEVMQRLDGRVQFVAPNLRGYERSSAPEDIKAYRVKHLVTDIAALIAQQGAPIDLLVAHDWGGAVAWNLAALRPELMHRLLIINSPHPATFLRELRDNPAQQAASAYMNFLCRPDAAALLAENDFARLWPFFENMGGSAWLDEPTRERYREVWRYGLEGALNYYRASPLRPPQSTGDAIHTLTLPAEMTTVRVPTTVLWGDADTALPLDLLDGLDAFVPDLDVQRVPGATHWIVHEQSERVAHVIAMLAAAAGRASSTLKGTKGLSSERPQ